jgi:hypothetical protein
MILDSELIDKNIIQKSYPLPIEIIEYVKSENWQGIDQYFLEAERPGGTLFEFMKPFLTFSSIEHIISIRTTPDDEDGIWHDDGSRILGFTLSLTPNPDKIVGGHLRFRKKCESEFISLPIRPLGEMLIFKTGIYGFEHMVSAVTQGKRVLVAGWCS